MKVRHKKTGEEFESREFNPYGRAEILRSDVVVHFGVRFKDLDVWVNGAWKDMISAFRDKDIIPDVYNKYFGLLENHVPLQTKE